MNGLKKTAVTLIVIMCIIRIVFAGYGYFFPHDLVADWGENLSKVEFYFVYMSRVWGIRDIVIGIMTLLALRKNVVPFLIACAVIDGSDALAAYLNYTAGLITGDESLHLIWIAMSCFIPETIALILLKLTVKGKEA